MFVPAGIDPERRRIVVGRPMVTVGRLVGQDPSGGVLLIRGDESSVSAELVSLKVEHDNGT
jgi:hypothetical protein